MPAGCRFRELIDSIYFAFGTRKDAACKCGNFKGIYKLHANCETCKFCLSHIVSMSLLFSWFSILSQVNFFLRIIPTHYKTCFLCCTLAPQPDLKQFQIVRVARISLKHINSDLENVVYVLLEKLRLLALLLC